MHDLLYKPDKTTKDVDMLLRQHKNLIYHLLHKYNVLHNQDAESAAWGALMDAIYTFDIYGKTAFSTYAYSCIRNSIYNVLRKERKPVSSIDMHEEIPDRAHENDTSRIEDAFKEHLSTRTRTARNILVVWRSSGFELDNVAIAKICNASASYVTRVQRDFKIFLEKRLRSS